MTVLMKRIKDLEANIAGLWVLFNESGLSVQEREFISIRSDTLKKVVKELTADLPAEEQQIRDAFEAGHSRAWFFVANGKHLPDIEAFLTHLKTKA